jgi:hypothetical protein
MDPFQAMVAEVARRLGSQRVKEQHPSLRFEDEITVSPDGERNWVPYGPTDLTPEQMKDIWLGSPGHQPTGVHIPQGGSPGPVQGDYPNVQQSWDRVQRMHPDVARHTWALRPDASYIGQRVNASVAPHSSTEQGNGIDFNPEIEFYKPADIDGILEHELVHVGQTMNWPQGPPMETYDGTRTKFHDTQRNFEAPAYYATEGVTSPRDRPDPTTDEVLAANKITQKARQRYGKH